MAAVRTLAVMFRRTLGAAVVLLALVAAASHASSATYSPCRQVDLPAWSPDGTQIVYYGRRWPAPGGHGNPNSVLQAYCTMNADGTNAQPLPSTVCHAKCQDPPGQIDWLRPDEILYLVDGGPIYRFAPGSKPTKLTTINDTSFAISADEKRIASGPFFPGCTSCAGPISVVSLASARIVGLAGGKKLANTFPSLSPDGKRVVFERDAADGSGKPFGIWTADANGRRLHQIAKVGEQPLWSPTGGQIAYLAQAGKTVALRVIAPGGGRSRTLVAKNVQNVFGWSPDGTSIAFESGTGTIGKLSVVEVATGKVRTLLQLHLSPSASWAPDSTELVANTVTKVDSHGIEECWATWRVPADGSTPTRLSSCS